MLDKEDVFCAWPKQGQLKSHRKTKCPCTFQEFNSTCIFNASAFTPLKSKVRFGSAELRDLSVIIEVERINLQHRSLAIGLVAE